MRAGTTVRGTGFGPYTVLDLHALPEDGKGYELEDGWLIEMPASTRHNWTLQTLAKILERAAGAADSPVVVCYGGEWELSTPAGVRKPDIYVVSRDLVRASVFDESPRIISGTEALLAVEVISPGSGSERTDRVRKVTEYAEVGIPQYWLVEHTPHLSAQVLQLDGTAYVADPVVHEGSLVQATVNADKPFSVKFDPADLLVF